MGGRSSARQLGRGLLCFALAALLGEWLCPAASASARPIGFALLRTGAVDAIAVQGDGKIVVAGNYGGVDGGWPGQARRFKVDGTIDGTWLPGAENVSLATIDPATGAIYLGGSFTNVQGQGRTGLARFATTGGLDGWAPLDSMGQPAISAVTAMVILPSGDVLAAVDRTNALGRALVRIAAADGVIDPAYLLPVDGTVSELCLAADGSVHVGGNFAAIGGGSTAHRARLLPGTLALDASGNTGSTQPLLALGCGFGPDPNVYFAETGGVVRRASAAGVLDPAWSVVADDAVHALHASGDGRIYLTGAFRNVDGVARSRVARALTANGGTIDPSWAPPPMIGAGRAITVRGNLVFAAGTLVLPGTDSVGLVTLAQDDGSGVGASYSHRLHAGNGVPTGAAPHADGGAIIVGDFSHTPDHVVTAALRLRPDATLDTEWQPLLDGWAEVAAAAPNGDVYLAGPLREQGVTRWRVLKVPAGSGGTLDPEWRVVADGASGGIVQALAVHGPHVLIGGGFSQLNGQAVNNIARATNGVPAAIDPQWRPALPSAGYRPGQFLGLGDGSVLVVPVVLGGVEFDPPPPPGPPRQLIHRITTLADGSATVAPYGPWFNGGQWYVAQLALDALGRVQLAGSFQTVELPQRRNAARMLPGGGLDPSWAPVLDGRYFVGPFAMDGDSHVYAFARFPASSSPLTARLGRHLFDSGEIDPHWESEWQGTGLWGPVLLRDGILLATNPWDPTWAWLHSRSSLSLFANSFEQP